MRRSRILSLLLVIGLLIQCVPVFAADSLVNIDKIVTTESRSFFIGVDGKVYTSGSNANGIAGLGDLALSIDKAVEIPYINNVKDIAANDSATYFVLTNGDVYVSGVGAGISSKEPKKIEGLSNVSKITTDGNSVMALKTDGTVYIQGDNSKGQLGAGSTKAIGVFTKLSGVSGVVDVQMGDDFSVLLFENGLVKATGLDVNGRLGLGNSNESTTTVYTLTSVNSPVGVSKIAVGKDQVLYLGLDGKLYTTGKIGSYTGVNSNLPKGVNVPTNVSIFNDKIIKDIKSAEGSYVLLSDNTLWTVGLNSYGQSLTGDTTTKTNYTKVASNISDVYVGEYQTFIKTTSNEIKAVGKNINGELGVGKYSNLVLTAQSVLEGVIETEQEIIVPNSIIKNGKITFDYAALSNKGVYVGNGNKDAIKGDVATNNGTVYLDASPGIIGNVFLGEGAELQQKNAGKEGITGQVFELYPKISLEYLTDGISLPDVPILPEKGTIIPAWNNKNPIISESGHYETISINSNYSVTIDTQGQEIHLVVDNLNIGQGHIYILGGGTVHLYLDSAIRLGSGSTVNYSGSANQLNIYVRDVGEIEIKGNSFLKANVYAPFASLNVANSGKVEGNISVGGSTILLEGDSPLRGNLYAPNANMKLTGSTNIYGNIILGGKTMNIGGTLFEMYGASQIHGGIYAPRADVVLNGSSKLVGGLISNTITIQGNAKIEYEEVIAEIPTFDFNTPEEPEVPEIPEIPVEEPTEDVDIPDDTKDLDYELIINVVTDGDKRIGAALSAYGDMLEHVDSSNNNLSLKRVNKLIDIFGETFSKDLKHGTYNFYEE